MGGNQGCIHCVQHHLPRHEGTPTHPRPHVPFPLATLHLPILPSFLPQSHDEPSMVEGAASDKVPCPIHGVGQGHRGLGGVVMDDVSMDNVSINALHCI